MIIIHDAYEVARACKEATQLQLLSADWSCLEPDTPIFNTVPISSKPSFSPGARSKDGSKGGGDTSGSLSGSGNLG